MRKLWYLVAKQLNCSKTISENMLFKFKMHRVY